jgi:hypothetical protein
MDYYIILSAVLYQQVSLAFKLASWNISIYLNKSVFYAIYTFFLLFERFVSKLRNKAQTNFNYKTLFTLYFKNKNAVSNNKK